VLTLRNRGEVDLPIRKGNLRRRAEDRCRCFLEDRILLILNGHLTRAGKESVGSIEGDAAEIVIDGVVDTTNKKDAVDEKALGVGT
jgi:hypothetical protein